MKMTWLCTKFGIYQIVKTDKSCIITWEGGGFGIKMT